MASIKISELRPAGSELFQDSESFLNELGAREMGFVLGGGQFNGQFSKNINNQQKSFNQAYSFVNK